MKPMADLNRRLIASLLVGTIVTLLIIFSSHLVVSWVLMGVVASLAAMGTWEYAQLAVAKEIKPRARLMAVVAALEVVAFYTNIPQLSVLILACAAVMFFLLHFNQTSNALPNIAVQFFGVCYVAVPLSFLLGILYPESGQDGKWWLIYLIAVTKVTDVGAYFVGRLWGRRPLAPFLSPKKTIEGAIAGLICAVGMSLLVRFLGVHFAKDAFALSWGAAVVLGVLISLFGQLGDLAESLLKRDAVVKDSNSLPGFGGVLDMVDSLLLTTPVLYFFMRMQ